jgi:dTDP-4-dehydrorhamnose reductase
MRILLLGARGQVGFELTGALASFADVVTSSRPETSLDADRVRPLVDDVKPDVIVNASAYNDVDGAEREPEVALAVNARLVGALGEACQRRRAALVHISTDFVFDGEKGAPYVETDAPAPLGEHADQATGERALAKWMRSSCCARLGFKFAAQELRHHHVWLREREEAGQVTDQIGNPTFCRDLRWGIALILYGCRANVVDALGAAAASTTWPGAASRYDWTRAILELDPHASEHRVKELRRIKSAEFPLPARRPLATPLETDKAFAQWGVRLPPWREALARALTS